MREAASDIDTQVARLDRVVGDVLDFARPLRIEAAPVDLPALVREATQAGLEGASVAHEPRFGSTPRPRAVVTDGERLRAALVNLVANARDSLGARPDGEREPAADVEIGTERLESGRIRLWVEDRGEGIAEADLPHVFEPYFTTKRTGSGLGLAIARKTVEALGGTIRLSSRPGAGARVEIELPAATPLTEER